jgi:hypothetical protein
VLTLSHWPKSGTPGALKRDTSAEIVFAYRDAPHFHVAAASVSNNHFDEDGLVGIYALTDPANADKHRELLLDLARAGDFGTYRSRDAARIAFTLSAYAASESSPFPEEVFALPYPDLAAELYQRLLVVLPRLLTHLRDYENWWGPEDAKLAASEEMIESGAITIEEQPALDLAVVHIPESLSTTTVHRFTQNRLAECHPFAIHNRTECSRILLVQGGRVEFQYRYESWVQYVSRKIPARIDLSGLAAELDREESSGGHWVFDGVDRITPRLHLEGGNKTSLPAEHIQRKLEQLLTEGKAAWDPFD